MVADCVPIVIVDPVHGAAAAVHAGWRGTCARVAPAAIDAMRREFGTEPADLVAAIGPSAGPDDYEVGHGLIDAFAAAGHDDHDIDRWFIRSKAKPHLDLWTANADQMIATGLRADRVFVSGLSTVSHATRLRLVSCRWRARGPHGRHSWWSRRRDKVLRRRPWSAA